VNKTVLAVAGPSKLECPECYAKMELVVVKGVQLDRCVKHGVWFDIGEISDVLRKTGKLPRDGVAREDKPSTGSKVAEGAASVGAAILEVVATAIDIVT
jgi:Zn-finger nucleic acid-binding protein